MADPITMLKNDHDKVKQLLREFESADGRSKTRIVNRVIRTRAERLAKGQLDAIGERMERRKRSPMR